MNSIEEQIDVLYDKIVSGEFNYFDLLHIKKTATFKEIESAYSEYIKIFSNENINSIEDEIKKKRAKFLEEKGKRAFKVLGDYNLKMKYEKNGYSEDAPKTPKEDDPIEKGRTLFGNAKVLYNKQRYDLAIVTLNEAISLDPDKASYYLLLGQSQAKLPDKIRDAEKNLLKVVELEDWNAEPLAALGLMFYSARFRSKAESYFRRALELEPKHILAKKKLEEITGPIITPGDKIKGVLAKVLPSLFNKK